MMAENIGQARLVPPTTPTLSCPLKVSINSAPVNGSASMEISGTNRTDPGRLLWNDGLAKVRLAPPPAPNWKPSCRGGTTGGPPKATVFAIRGRVVSPPGREGVVVSGFSGRLGGAGAGAK